MFQIGFSKKRTKNQKKSRANPPQEEPQTPSGGFLYFGRYSTPLEVNGHLKK